MKKILAVLVLVLFSLAFAPSADAKPGDKAFYRGLIGQDAPSQLAGLNEDSLKMDPSGKTLLDPVRCKSRDKRIGGSCATPLDYFLMFVEMGFGLKEVSEVPNFLRALIAVPFSELDIKQEEEFWVAVIRTREKGRVVHKPILRGINRTLNPGETVWVHPISRQMVLAGDCTNPFFGPVIPRVRAPELPPPVVKEKVVVVEEVEECAEIEFTARKGDEISNAFFLGAENQFPESVCWQPMLPCEDCSWEGSKKIIPASYHTLGRAGKYVVKETGLQVLRFPLQVKDRYIVLCNKREGFGHSRPAIIEPNDFQFGNRVVVHTFGQNAWPVWVE